VRFDIEMNSP